jgi:hypothetical protein
MIDGELSTCFNMYEHMRNAFGPFHSETLRETPVQGWEDIIKTGEI